MLIREQYAELRSTNINADSQMLSALINLDRLCHRSDSKERTRAVALYLKLFFFSSRRRHTRLQGDWSSDVCSSDLSTGTQNFPITKVSTRNAKPTASQSSVYVLHRARERLSQWIEGTLGYCLTVIQIGRASCRERV